MITTKQPTESLHFRHRDGRQATVVTNGNQVRTYEPTRCLKHRKLSSAIAHLEAVGYVIEIDNFS